VKITFFLVKEGGQFKFAQGNKILFLKLCAKESIAVGRTTNNTDIPWVDE